VSVFNPQTDRPSVIPDRRPPQPFQQPGSLSNEATQNKPSVLGKTLVFKGELWADEDLVLQGRVEGSIHHEQSLTVGPDGVVIGGIRARSILVEGTVEGDLHGSASVIVAATAKVRGNIVAPRVGIMEGASFNGSVDMSGAQSDSIETAATRSQRSNQPALSDRSVDQILSRP
jgi:cytoskeletal protein CcmA (bactofilin family)